MAKIKYDVKGVESRGDRPVPKPGVYRCKIISCVDAKPDNKDRRLEVQYEITDGDSKGYRLYDYIVFAESSEWKLAQFIRACGLPEKGTLDPDKLVGTALNVRTRVENSEEYGTSAKPASLMPLDGDDDEDEEDLTEDEETEEEVDETEDDDTEDDDESEEDEDDESDDEEDEDWTEEELESLDSKELRAVAEDYDDVTVPAKLTAAAKKKLIAAILEAQGGDDDEEEDEEEKPDYDSMDLADLKALAKERKLSPKGNKKVLVARLEKDDDPFS